LSTANKDAFFNKEHQVKTKKPGLEEAAFRVIVSQEVTERESKTAKLRELRLQKEAEQPPEPEKPKRGRASKK
jgi:hypothetical protein